ncbi:GrpB family protein [Acinetobacter haemolyticus]|uniref:GrpB family protein n=1 Tax=Acinetobacter haemolyticus TaxID=29430 RepID=UPI003AF84361
MQFFPPDQYQQHCQQLFEKYKNQILNLTPYAIVEHIGSSAIPNAVSKGDLDIYIEIPQKYFLETIDNLKKLNFKEKLDTLRTNELCMLESLDNDVALQIVTSGSVFRFFLIFRDRLKESPDLVEQYDALKHSCTGIPQDRYRELKAEFIQRVLKMNNDIK